MKPSIVVLGAALLATPVSAQDPAPVYQAEEQYSFKLHGDGLLRQEWTRDIFQAPHEDRQRFQLRPRLELGYKKLLLGVGGEFNYSSDENTLPPAGATVQPLIRDNYDSRDARLDLAFLSVRPARFLHLVGGRFLMPIRFTEMIWDRDLRPQGAALTLETRDRGRLQSLGITALGAQGSHVFDDDDTRMLAGSVQATFGLGDTSRLELMGAYVTFEDVPLLETRLRRQNTRVAGAIVRQYDIVDAIARLSFEAPVATELVADFSWNTAADDQNRGVWLAAVLGSTKSARARAEYVFARMDKDATVAAYGADDFFWVTGWEGHRGDLGIRLSDKLALHGVGQLQKFKDSPRAAERGLWQKRYRVDLRATY